MLRQLGEEHPRFVINRGYDKHLTLYPEKVWDEKRKVIDELSMFVEEERLVIRYFYGGANKVILDNSDRILIPKILLDHAGIKGELVVFAFQDIIELWSSDEHEKMVNAEPDNIGEITERIIRAKREELKRTMNSD